MHYCSERERDEWAAALGFPSSADALHTPHDPAARPLPNGTGHLDAVSCAAPAAPTLVPAVTAAAPSKGEAHEADRAVDQPALHARCHSGQGSRGPLVALLAAIELGSHSTRAVLHDGCSELVRLTYDTMLGQPATQPHAAAGEGTDGSSGGGGGGVGGSDGATELHPEAVERTLGALRRVAAAAAAAAAALGAGAGASQAATTASAAAEAAPGAEAGLAAAASAGGSGAMDYATGLVSAPGSTNGAERPALLPCGGEARASGWPAAPLVARMVGTAAVRSAGRASRAALAAAAEGLVGCPLEVLSGEDEGLLAWRGVTGGLDGAAAAATAVATALHQEVGGEAGLRLGPSAAPQRPLLVVDMGGRSTEFTYGIVSGTQVPEAVSVPLGCVGLHSSALRAAEGDALAGHSGHSGEAASNDLKSLPALAACVRIAEQMVRRHCSEHPWLQAPGGSGHGFPTAAPSGAEPTVHEPASTSSARHAYDVVFTGGTVTTLAALHLRLPRYDRARVHGSVLTASDIQGLMVQLASPGGAASALASYDWLTEARCRTLAAGCAGLLGVMAALGLERAGVSDADLLDGLLCELLQGWRGDEHGAHAGGKPCNGEP